jgi:hypothetical protein
MCDKPTNCIPAGVPYIDSRSAFCGNQLRGHRLERVNHLHAQAYVRVLKRMVPCDYGLAPGRQARASHERNRERERGLSRCTEQTPEGR